ncbi:hypothetical protein JCM10213v2_008643 [Rhodosporidiobolus nylandii]
MSTSSHEERKSIDAVREGNVERAETHAHFLPTASSTVPPVAVSFCASLRTFPRVLPSSAITLLPSPFSRVPPSLFSRADTSLIDNIAQTGNEISPPGYTVATQAGVLKVESAQRVWGRNSRIALFIGIALASYIYALDGNTTWQYQAYATSSFAQHSLLGAIATAQAIIIAVAKPWVAKVGDVFGRAEAFSVCVFFYCLGYIIVAACKNVHTYAAGAIIYEVGYAGLQILIQIVIADCTNLRWRGLVSSLTSIWFFINAFVSANIVAGILKTSNWHWGYGMFIILIPVCVAPIVATLAWAQHRAKKLGLDATDLAEKNGGTAARIKDTRPIAQRVLGWAIDIDALGLLLFGAGWACVLVPLTLVNKATLWWDSGKIIALLVVGGCTLIAFVVFERFFAVKPLFPFRFFKSYTVVACALIGFFDFVSFYLQYTYQYSFIYDWSYVDQGYFAYTQTLTLTFAAIAAGFFQLYFRRTKWLLVCGLCVRLLGVGLMIKSKGADGSTAFLVWTQVLQGLGGGVASASTQLLAQASVPHQDVATVTAFVLLFAEIGNAVGTAIATAIWRHHMPEQLAEHLAGLANQTTIDGIYGSITDALTYKASSPEIYDGIIASYSYTMKILLIAATAVAVIPPLLAVGVQNIYLSDAHNAVEGEALDGRPIEEKDKESKLV